MPLNRDEFDRLQYASETLAGVLRADSVWTSLVTASGGAKDLSVEAVDEIAAQFTGLRDGIDAAVRAGEEIVEVAEETVRNDPAFQEAPKSLVGALDLEIGPAAVGALASADFSLLRLAGQGSGEMREGRSEAVSMLVADLRGVLCGTTVKGYLPGRFLCGLAKASMVAGLLTVWIPPHAHAGAAVALGATVYTTAGCGKKPATP